MEIKIDKEIAFGKYKGYVLNKCIDLPQYEFKKFFNYLIWANKTDDIKIGKKIMKLFFKKQQEYNWEAEKSEINYKGNSLEWEPRLWGNDCFEGEMSSWF